MPNEPVQLFGDTLRIDFIHNSGGLFGILQNSVPAFAVMSVVVVVFIVALELRSGWRSWPVTFALTLLLGGAIGNFIDRVRLGYVIDFVDLGVGPWRWYIFNLADSAVTIAIVMLIGLSFLAPAALSLSEPAADRGDGPDAAEQPGPDARPPGSGRAGEGTEASSLAGSDGQGDPYAGGDPAPAGEPPPAPGPNPMVG